MTGRPGLAVGEHGDIWIRPTAAGRFQARTRVRDRDGRRRDATATGDTRGSAKRALERRLAERLPQSVVGLTSSMTVEQAAAFWMAHRKKSGRVHTKGPIKPQTLGAYNDALRLLVVPAMGGLKLGELRVGLLDAILGDLEEAGQSTAQARSVLNQMLGLAVRHGALSANPMALVARPQREAREVEALDVERVRLLRQIVRPEALRRPGKRGPNGDLRDVVDFALGTGCRIGELLAVQWQHLDLSSESPSVRICGTLVEPRTGFVAQLERQESTKTKTVRTLVLPEAVVASLTARREHSAFDADTDPVFAASSGRWLWPNNLRTRLRAAVGGHELLAGTTPHTLRRTVGTLIAHERGLDAAREQLGHSDSSVTFLSYVAARPMAPDHRDLLSLFFELDD